MSDGYQGRVRQDADGRWDWQVIYDGHIIAQALKQIGYDERPYRRKTAVKTVRRIIAARRRQDAAEWQEV